MLWPGCQHLTWPFILQVGTPHSGDPELITFHGMYCLLHLPDLASGTSEGDGCFVPCADTK